MGKKSIDLPIPNNLRHCSDCNAFSGERILARFNKCKGPFTVPHKNAGGRGQGIFLKKAVVWIEEAFER